jgi:hypothetical protein
MKDEEDAEDQRGWSLPPSTLYWLVIATRYQLALWWQWLVIATA